MSADEQTGWLPDPGPALDPTPIETGGAVLVMRLTPDEVATLLRLAPTLPEAVHELVKGQS